MNPSLEVAERHRLRYTSSHDLLGEGLLTREPRPHPLLRSLGSSSSSQLPPDLIGSNQLQVDRGFDYEKEQLLLRQRRDRERESSRRGDSLREEEAAPSEVSRPSRPGHGSGRAESQNHCREPLQRQQSVLCKDIDYRAPAKRALPRVASNGHLAADLDERQADIDINILLTAQQYKDMDLDLRARSRLEKEKKVVDKFNRDHDDRGSLRNNLQKLTANNIADTKRQRKSPPNLKYRDFDARDDVSKKQPSSTSSYMLNRYVNSDKDSTKMPLTEDDDANDKDPAGAGGSNESEEAKPVESSRERREREQREFEKRMKERLEWEKVENERREKERLQRERYQQRLREQEKKIPPSLKPFDLVGSILNIQNKASAASAPSPGYDGRLMRKVSQQEERVVQPTPAVNSNRLDIELDKETVDQLAKTNLYCDNCDCYLTSIMEVKSHIETEEHLKNKQRKESKQKPTDGFNDVHDSLPKPSSSSSINSRFDPHGISSLVKRINESQTVNLQLLMELKNFKIATDEEAELVKQMIGQLSDSLYKYRTDNVSPEVKEVLRLRGLLRNNP